MNSLKENMEIIGKLSIFSHTPLGVCEISGSDEVTDTQITY